MTIIICGPNGAGKSTLARQLSDYLGYEVVHSVKQKNYTDSIKIANEELLRVLRDEDVILDRVQCISYPIYNEGDDGMDRIAKAIMAFGIPLIYCIGKGEINFEGKDHYDESLKLQCINDADNIREKYNKAMNKLDHIKYNFEEEDAFKKLIVRIDVYNY